MKKILQKSCAWLVMLVAMFAMSGTAMAETVTFNFNGGDKLGTAKNGVTVQMTNAFDYSGWGIGYYIMSSPATITVTSDGKMIESFSIDNSSASQGAYYQDNWEVTTGGTFVANSKKDNAVVTPTAPANTVTARMFQGSSSNVNTLTVVLQELTDPIHYTVNFVGEVPAGCSATLGDETFSSNWSDDILEVYGESALTTTTTEDYYADVTYDEGTHTWTVAFKPWLVYTVEVTIPSYNPNAVVEYQGDYYENGETIKSKTALTDSDFEAYDLNGYDESVTVEGNVVKVVYTESAAMEYHIVIENAPVGASVTVNGDQTFTESGSYFTPLVLQDYHFSCNVPEGWYEDHTYNAGSRTYTVDFYEYTHYSVVVEGTEDAAAGVVYNWTTYHEGETLHGEGLTASSVSAASVSGLVGTVTLDGTTFTVTYTKPEYISFDTSNVGWTIDMTIDGVRLTANGWSSRLDLYQGQPVTISAVDYNIDKIVFISDSSLPSLTCSSGSFDATTGTWTNGGATNTVTLEYTGWADYFVKEVRVWLKEPEPVVAPEFPVQGKAYAIKNADANKYLNLVESADKGTVLGNAPEALYFTWDAMKAGFTITNEAGLYVGGHSNNWNMASNIAEYWTVEDAGTGLYYIKCLKGYMGVDDTAVGSATFRDKTFGDMIVFTIEEYVAPAVASFTMGAAGWATLCIDKAFAVPEGYKAYTAGKDVAGVATLVEADQIVLAEIENVPARTPVILEGPAANVNLYAPTATPVEPPVNFLQGNVLDTPQNFSANTLQNMYPGDWEVYDEIGPCQLYQLAKENDLVGFYRQVEDGSTLECGAHKAFLVVPTSVAASNARFVLPGQEGPTGIGTVLSTEASESIYNLQGQRVLNAKSGVYVKNGKKVIVK